MSDLKGYPDLEVPTPQDAMIRIQDPSLTSLERVSLAALIHNYRETFWAGVRLGTVVVAALFFLAALLIRSL